MAEVIRLDTRRPPEGVVTSQLLRVRMGAPAIASMLDQQRFARDYAYYEALLADRRLHETLLDVLVIHEHVITLPGILSLLDDAAFTKLDLLRDYSLEQITLELQRSERAGWVRHPEYYWVLLVEWLARMQSIFAARDRCS